MLSHLTAKILIFHFWTPPRKSFQLLLMTERADMPIYLASISPKNFGPTGDIVDGWLGSLRQRRTCV